MTIGILYSLSVFAQTGPLVENITDILAQKNLQNKENARALSKLEDQANDICTPEAEKHESCQGFAQSLLPKGYKEKGWKTLLEIKYQALGESPNKSSARGTYQSFDFETYRDWKNKPEKEITTGEELEAAAKDIQRFYKDYKIDTDLGQIKNQLIIEQLSNPNYYKNLTDLKAQNDLMYKRIGEYTKTMSDQDYLKFVSAMAGYVDYNEDRSRMVQTDEASKGLATPFQQITGSKSGICGDIHSMAAKMGEARGWEAFTVGYMLSGSQHVVTAMANPKDPNNLMIVNYGNYQIQDMKNGQWINPTPTNGMNEIGMQLRIFKNDKTGDANGKMKQIATIPTALGSFMNDLFVKENQIAKAMPSNQNYTINKVGAQTSTRKTEEHKNGNKITDRLATEGVVIYEGETDNAQIYGIAVSHDIYKDIYKWDEKQNKCVLKKNKYFSIGVAGSLVDLTQTELDKTFYAYLNMKGGKILHVYQSEHFQFKGVIGYEMSAIFSNADHAVTADANFTTLMGVIADYNKNGTKIHTALTYETNLAVRDQPLMYDMSKLTSNYNPIGFNAISLDANIEKKISGSNRLVSNNNLTITKVGGRVLLSTGLLHKNTSIMLSYQGGVKPYLVGDSLKQVNLLQNYNNMDGFRLSLGQNFTSRNRSISGSLSGYGGISTSTLKPIPMAGATLKLNLGGSKKKRTGH